MREEAGYTLVEILVALTLVSTVSTGFYLMMSSGVRSSDHTRDISEVSQEARLGFNRMIRETREADEISAYTADAYTVKIDFDGDGSYSSPNSDGDHEVITFSFDSAARNVMISTPASGSTPAQSEVLMRGVESVVGEDVFSYSSNHLEYDWDADGVTTLTELQAAGTHGVNLTATEISAALSSVTYAIRLETEGCAEPSGGDCLDSLFYAEAQLRNRR